MERALAVEEEEGGAGVRVESLVTGEGWDERMDLVVDSEEEEGEVEGEVEGEALEGEVCQVVNGGEVNLFLRDLAVAAAAVVVEVEAATEVGEAVEEDEIDGNTNRPRAVKLHFSCASYFIQH